MKGHCKYCGQGPDQVICYKILHSSYEAAKLSRVTKWFVKSLFFSPFNFSTEGEDRLPPTFLLAPEYELGVRVPDLHDAGPLVSDAR